MKTKIILGTGLFVFALAAPAGEIGHFNGGIMNIRDYVMPEPGFYGLMYNYFYSTIRAPINLPKRDGQSANQWL